ncbi:MAG TPA: M12 family metallo-peptidase [Anaerolineae bacterium]|nr:M12 family metallo-peptidase [Anaerolineae bacterium]
MSTRFPSLRSLARRSFVSRSLALLALLMTVLLLGGQTAIHAQGGASSPELFQSAPVGVGQGALPQGEAALSSRWVTVNLDLLQAGADSPALRLPLRDDRVVEVQRDALQAVTGGQVWTGHVAGAPVGQVVLSQVGDALAGNIVLSSGERYHLRHAGKGLHRLERVDQSRYPDEAPPLVPSATELSLAAVDGATVPTSRPDTQPSTTDADDCGRIDVLVIYDAAARMAAGGADAMLAEINLGVAETNQAYANSGIGQRVSLVHAAEAAVAIGASANAALTNLKADAGVQALRNSYGADLVSYWVATLPGACGIGYKMNTVSTAFAPFGYSLVDRDCATGYYSFAHEMGHNMGADHDWFVAGGTLPSSTAHGYVNVAARWRTIMAYNDRCQAQTPSVNCARLPYFSNPNINIGGLAAGVAAGTSTACTVGNTGNPNCDADNRAVLNGSACAVAGFRDTSPGRADVWMKDTWSDTGREPDPATAGQGMWLSPYIWIRNAADPGLLHQHEHQNPESASANHAFVKLHNGGNAAASGRLKLYYARASTGLAWPANWTQFADIAATVPANSTGVASAIWNTTAAQTGHFCLLARWESAGDPMTFAETGNVDQNTRRNNNIVWRNVNIVNLVAPDQLMQEARFLVRNTGKERADLSLAFTWPTGGGANQLPFQRQGRAVIQLGERLRRAMENGGDTNGLEPLGDGRYLLTDPKGSRLYGLDLDAGEEDEVAVTFEAQPELVGSEPRAFRLEAAQFTAGETAAVGGVAWEIMVRPPRSEMGTVRGVAFDDRNGNAVREDDEPGLPERQLVFTDAGGEQTTAHSDGSGAYALQLAPGAYKVAQVLPDGWVQTSPAEAQMAFEVGGSQRVWELSFGSWRPREQPASCKPPARLVNLSTRGFVGTGDGVMIAGFIIRDRPARVVVRALGPGLKSQGVAGALSDPTLQVYGGQAVLAEIDDWAAGATAAELKAAGLAPGEAKEPGLVLTLQPGAYTAIVRGAGERTGIALVEVFQID